MTSIEGFLFIILSVLILIISVSIHESAHAWTANKLGDPTAKHLGRISLNPFVHIDPVGTVLVPILLLLVSLPLVGWAKPTPFNPWNLANPRRDSALISFAGPLSNFFVAAILSIFFRIGLLSFMSPFSTGSDFSVLGPIERFSVIASLALILNLILGIFNLLPIAPLDGFKVVAGILPRDLALRWSEFERIGPLVLIAVIFFGGQILSPIIFGALKFFLQILIG